MTGSRSEPRAGPTLPFTVLAALVVAFAPSHARAETLPRVLWFRSSQGCPEGAAFLARLAEDAARVRLSQAGDRVDFVLTLERTEPIATGRLERQTAEGTIAVAELRDASCEAVADGLALSLSLALQPEAAASSEPAAVSTPEPTPTPSEAPATPPVAPVPLTAPPAPGGGAPAPGDTDGDPPNPGLGVRLGVDGGVAFGLLPDPSARAGLYAELDQLGGPLPNDCALRFGALGLVGATDTRAGRVTQFVLVERTAACPLRFGSAALSVAPCALLDLGVIGGGGAQPTGVSDVGFWAALGAELLLRWEPAAAVALELGAGGLAPITRYGVADAAGTLYETGSVAFLGSLGVSFRLK